MALRVSMILDMVDRITAPAKRIKANVSGLVGGFRTWGKEVRKVSNDITSGARSLEHYDRRARRLRQVALGSFFRATRIQIRQSLTTMDAWIAKLKLAERAATAAKSSAKWIGGKALGAAKWAAAGAGALASFSVFDLFKTAGQFEQYQVMLEGTEGSARKAKQAMAWVQKFAKDTPYELDQVMEAFVQLKAYGMDPMDGSLRTLGDAASGMNKQIMDAVETIADAMQGENERLKSFAIRASQQGDKVTYSYQKNGQDIQRTAKSTAADIKKTLLEIFSDRFGGGMKRQSTTLFGILRNIKDIWSGFLLMIADAGIFDKVKAKLESWQTSLNAMAEDGRLRAWADKISERLEQAFDWATKLIEDTNWTQVGADLKTIADAAWTLATAIAYAVENLKKYATLASLTPEIGLPLRVLSWVSSDKSDGKPSAGQPLPKARRDQLWQGAKPGGSGWKRLPQSGGGKPASAAPVKVGGALDITVKVQGNGTATVQRMASSNPAVPLRAKTGKVMGGAA